MQRIFQTLIVAGAMVLLAGCQQESAPAPGKAALEKATANTNASEPAEPADYVGSEACAACHRAEWEDWQESHHDLALQAATSESVLAPFIGEHLSTRFDQSDDGYHLTPPDAGARVEVVYTFGVWPLQQYVVPADGGALQTYPIAWDHRPADEGGQRWYNLHDDVYPAGDPMHWAGRANRWNSQCADCHSTAVEKHYDATEGRYQTTFAVEDVGCEACHGPGSVHVQDPLGGRLPALRVSAEQIEVCAPCHSRRSHLAEGFRPGAAYLDHYAPRLLTPDLYHVDGQIDDEVYVYGSFLQSRMHRAGVTCSQCHNPHSAELARPGNDTCTFCHQPSPDSAFGEAAGRFDDPAHHLHDPGSPGSFCVDCHMPAKTYMGVDDRRDHSFRIPRPDLAVTLGVPDPCTACHTERSPEWAAEAIADQFGPDRPPHFAAAFAEADGLSPGADAALAELVADETQPIMVRASALSRLAGYSRGYTLDSVRLAVRSGEPLLRYAAPLAAASLSADSQWRLLSPLLEDDLRAVRHQAIGTLLDTTRQDPSLRPRIAPYVNDWLNELALNLDFPETRTRIAGAHLAMGDPGRAEEALEASLDLQANWVPGLLNLADLYRATGRDADAGPLLERALGLVPEDPAVLYPYALWLSRSGRLEEALTYFDEAVRQAPDQPVYAYAHALALNDTGNGVSAVAVLESLLTRWPENEQALVAVVTMLRDQGRYAEALDYLDRLLLLRPTDTELLRFRQALAAAAAAA
jgi:tetratricopeptide (TPR) repeat protein